MKKLKLLAAAFAAAALPFCAFAKDEATISLKSVADQNTQPIIKVRSIYDFEKRITLKVKDNPNFNAEQALIKMVSQMDLKDISGITIKPEGFDADTEHDLVIGFSGGTSEIIKVAKAPNGLRINSNFKSKDGQYVSPPKGAVGVFNSSGIPLCFSYKTVKQAASKMRFIILLDRSGSMSSHEDQVSAAAQSLMKSLPPSAQCNVMSFASRFSYHSNEFRNCQSGNISVAPIDVGGGTVLYTPLLSAYNALNQNQGDDYQKTVIIVTDGFVSGDRNIKAQLGNNKKDTLTLGYFIGSQNKSALNEITDGYVQGSNDVTRSIHEYFGAISTAYNTQKVLQVEPCKRQGYAAR